MQPTLNINPRAILIKSAPNASAIAILSGVTSCPEAIIYVLSRIPYFFNKSSTSRSALNTGNPTDSTSS